MLLCVSFDGDVVPAVVDHGAGAEDHHGRAQKRVLLFCLVAEVDHHRTDEEDVGEAHELSLHHVAGDGLDFGGPEGLWQHGLSLAQNLSEGTTLEDSPR